MSQTGTTQPTQEKRFYDADTLGMARSDFDHSALAVVQALVDGGHEAYLVGGCMRDLLVGLKPKDFDIATSAKPEQIKQIFGRKSQIIGRRFKIVHVYQDRQLFEVTTFRSEPDPNHRGDNTFGDLAQDATRRDFTINALYYDSQTHQVIDFFDALSDIQQKRIVMIGDCVERVDEDPVRMLRAVRFRQQLSFELDQELERVIGQYGHRLAMINASRLALEVNKLFLKGYGYQNYQGLKAFGLLTALFPSCGDIPSSAEPFLKQALENSDRRVQEDKPVIAAFVYAVMLWPTLMREFLLLSRPNYTEVQELMHELLNLQNDQTQLNRFQKQVVKDIWQLQFRLNNTRKKYVEKLVGHPKFRAGYDFLCLRESSGLIRWEQNKVSEPGMAAFWTDYQEKHPIKKDGKHKQTKGDHSATRKKPSHRRSRRPKR
ncbi:MAG: polynucleotide adenylyltransferase PcnB [Pseudomonadota bacterium]|nr:polynucleotide adenylyltransferase PcnB [Pseudomonadota bacterium]